MSKNGKIKSKRVKTFVPVLLGGLCFIGFVYGMIRFIGFVLDHLRELNPNVTTALITVCGTFFVSLISILIAKHHEHKAEIRREQHAKKVEIYEDFIGIWFDVLFADKLEKKQLTEKELLSKLAPIIRQLIPWGSDDFIKSFVKFRDCAAKMEDSSAKGLHLFDSFEKVLFDIRKDLGHPNKGLKKGDLSRIFINDYDEYAQKHAVQGGSDE